MTSPVSGPVLSAAQTRAAEAAVIAMGSSVDALMTLAGRSVATWVQRIVGGRDVLILCGPGNNGGDGYVAAAALHRVGVAVRVAASGEPRTEAALRARALWPGTVEPLQGAAPASVVVDALFGTGLTRPLTDAMSDDLNRVNRHAQISVAVDVPSGVNSDTGEDPHACGRLPASLTLALGTLKPAHLLQPAAAACGAVRVIDLGLVGDPASTAWPDRTIEPPRFCEPTAASHKYSRGMVVVIGGMMPGAAALAAEAALHAGAGYVLTLGGAMRLPHAIVQRPWSVAALADVIDGKRNACIVIGPGLGRDADAVEKLEAAFGTTLPLVVDGDALRLLDNGWFERIKARKAVVILTPHAGEFDAMFGAWSGSKIDAARAASAQSGAVVVFKGADTVIARPDGTTSTAIPGSVWLSTAGTGDVLAGAIAASVVTASSAAAEAGVWLHAKAARQLGGPFSADQLAQALAGARASAARG